MSNHSNRRWLSIACSVGLALVLAACGDDEYGRSGDDIDALLDFGIVVGIALIVAVVVKVVDAVLVAERTKRSDERRRLEAQTIQRELRAIRDLLAVPDHDPDDVTRSTTGSRGNDKDQ